MQSTTQRRLKTIANPRRLRSTALIVASVLVIPQQSTRAENPPANLAKLVAEREARNEQERAQYSYRQTVLLEELSERGAKVGEYREVREIVFSPTGDRIDQIVGSPQMNLKRLRLTEEDFRDMRDVQPFLFTPDRFFMYDAKLKGEEIIDGMRCWVLQVRPRQYLAGMRYFDGIFWIDPADYSIVRSEGKAVPQMYSSRAEKENLFPAFTTFREKVGANWFPVLTKADDVLHFQSGPVREKLTIRYRDYKRFSAESKITPTP